MEDRIREIVREVLSESSCPHIELTDEIIKYVQGFDSDEQLLRSGGVPTDMLDQAAYGFSEKNLKTIMPDKLKIRWHDDLENVKWEIDQKEIEMLPEKYTLLDYAKSVDLSEPIDVSYMEREEEGLYRGFYVEDGHHRYYAAKILGVPLNVNLEIKVNPIKTLGGGIGYDDFHRCLFKQVKI